MKYVYLIQSVAYPDEYYTGSTDDFNERLRAHNAGKSPHTAKYLPWKPVVVLCFADPQRAADFALSQDRFGPRLCCETLPMSNRLSAVFRLRATSAHHATFYAQIRLGEHLPTAKPLDEVPAEKPEKRPERAISLSDSLRLLDAP